MKQTVDMKRYEQLHNVFERKETRIAIDLNTKLADVRSTIGFQFWLFEEVERIAMTGKIPVPFRLHNQLIYIVYQRNCYYLAGSEILTKYGLISPCNNNLRSVYEGILIMYYLRFHPTEAKLVLRRFSAVKKSKKLIHLLKVKDYYSHKFLLETLYDGNKKTRLRRFYSLISKAAHPSIQAVMYDNIYKKSSVLNALDALLVLSYANITAFLETFLILFDKAAIPSIEESRLRILDSLGYRYSFEPNHPSINKAIRIRGTKIKTNVPSERV